MHCLGFAGTPAGAWVEDLSHVNSANFARSIARRNGVGEERSEPVCATCPVLGLKVPRRVAFPRRGSITPALRPLLAPSCGVGGDWAARPGSLPAVTAPRDAAGARALHRQDVVTPAKRPLPGGPCSELFVVRPGGWKHQQLCYFRNRKLFSCPKTGGTAVITTLVRLLVV